MKKQKKQNRYQEKVEWDDMTIGELSHHIGKKMTEKVVKSKKHILVKPNIRTRGIEPIRAQVLHFVPKRSSVRLRYPPQCSVRLSVRTPGFHPGKRGSIPLPSTK